MCNNCVDITDHHCTFLNNCIGKRNYLSFYTFLITSIVSSALVISLSSYHLYYAHSHPSGSEDFLSSYQTIIALIVIIFSFLLMVPILGLFLYHTYLIASNRTTIEMVCTFFLVFDEADSVSFSSFDRNLIDRLLSIRTPEKYSLGTYSRNRLVKTFFLYFVDQRFHLISVQRSTRWSMRGMRKESNWFEGNIINSVLMHL